MRDFQGWDARALWEDIKWDAKHFNQIERVAMVGDKKWQEWMAAFCKPFTLGTCRIARCGAKQPLAGVSQAAARRGRAHRCCEHALIKSICVFVTPLNWSDPSLISKVIGIAESEAAVNSPKFASPKHCKSDIHLLSSVRSSATSVRCSRKPWPPNALALWRRNSA
jgi:hypothetical protein